MSVILNHVTHIYSQGSAISVKALDDVSLHIEEGEFLAVIGHTGSGKSTLALHINGLLKPTAGQVLCDGRDISDDDYDISELRSKVGLIFQYPEYQLFETTVMEDVCFGPMNLGATREEAEEAAYEALELLKLPEEKWHVSPFELSGGQKRRVAIAGVLAMKPSILVLDEPTAGLDPKGRQELLTLISALKRVRDMGIVLISHSMDDVAAYADRVAVMDKGRIVMNNTPAEVFKKGEELSGMGLGVPAITRINYELYRAGLSSAGFALTMDEAVMGVCERAPGGFERHPFSVATGDKGLEEEVSEDTPSGMTSSGAASGDKDSQRTGSKKNRTGKKKKSSGEFGGITFGQYYQTASVIHRLDPRTKLLGTFMYIVALFICNDPVTFGAAFAFLALSTALSRVPVRYMLRGIKGLAFIMLFTVVFNVFLTPGVPIASFGIFKITMEGIKVALMLALRLVLLLTGTSLMTFTTTPNMLTDGLEALLLPLRAIRVPVHEIAMMMSIAIRFIPILMEETEKIMKAQMARGADFETGGFLKRAKAMIPLLVPLFVSAFRRASDLALAMEARCYTGGEERTRLNPLRYAKRDAIAYLILLCFILFVISV